MNLRPLVEPALLGCVAALFAAGLTGRLDGYGGVHAAKKQVSPAAAVFTASHPTEPEAFQALYGTDGIATQYRVDANHLASVWFSKNFREDGRNLFVVFAEVQEADKRGTIASCHACVPSVDSITFVHSENGWTSSGIQRNLGAIGSWGKTPTLDGNEVELLALSTGSLAFLIPVSDTQQGVSSVSTHLLAFRESKWAIVGDLATAADNSGASCSASGPGIPSGAESCYSFTGQIRLAKTRRGKSPAYPDILVIRRGTDFDEASNSVKPVGTERYAFDGKQYVRVSRTAQAQSPTEALRQAASAPAWEIALGGKITRCSRAAAHPEQDSAGEAPKPMLQLLMDTCPNETLNWVESCKRRGVSSDDCYTKLAALARAARESESK